jgi:hypothetical protein
MRIMRSKRFLVLMGVVLPVASLTAAALAAVTSQTVLAEGTTLRVRVIKTVANDFDSGWHIHPGPAIVQVQEGSFQITQGSCTPRTVNTGDTFVEVPFSPVRAVATGRVAWTTTLLGRAEDSLNTPTTSPCP